MEADQIVGRISIVVPVYNEVESLDPLYEALVPVLEHMNRPVEVILVDDGSEDGSADVMDEIAEKDKRFTVIHLRRNFGQTAAMAAGFDYARGEAIVAMDADLQNDPTDIPMLVNKLEEGYDVVSGWRKNRKDPWLTRKLPSRLANGLISRVTGVHLHDYGCSLKAYRAEVIKDVKLYGDMHRFIPVLAKWAGARVTEMVVKHHPRKYGQSKYGLKRTLQVLLDLATVKFLLAYSTHPLQIFGRWGLAMGGLGFLLALWLTIQKLFFGAALSDRPALILAVLMILVGTQLISMGLIAELQSRTYYESQDKPVYTVRYVKYKEGRVREGFPGD
jgi:glycosyltransferase involved in cell wall biosynthesis